ncbi:MAG: hypothetical protein JXR44_05170 [Thiotrichales bacterium]|nr:hypothetical protein [Thiotrichales bacterium]
MKHSVLLASSSLMAALFLAPTTQAQTTPSTKQISCELLKVTAQDMIRSRQDGQVMSAVAKRVLEDNWEYRQADSLAYQYLHKAYQVPVQLDESAKQKAIQTFSSQAYEDCLCNWTPRPAKNLAAKPENQPDI